PEHAWKVARRHPRFRYSPRVMPPTDSSLALQGTSAAQLARTVSQLTLAEARKVVSAVHRGVSLDGPVVGVLRASLETIRRVGYVPSLEVHAERASLV